MRIERIGLAGMSTPSDMMIKCSLYYIFSINNPVLPSSATHLDKQPVHVAVI